MILSPFLSGFSGSTPPGMPGLPSPAPIPAAPQIAQPPNAPRGGICPVPNIPSQAPPSQGYFSGLLNDPTRLAALASLARGSGAGQAPGFFERLLNPSLAAALQDTGMSFGPSPAALAGMTPLGMPAGAPMISSFPGATLPGAPFLDPLEGAGLLTGGAAGGAGAAAGAGLFDAAANVFPFMFAL